MATNRTIIERSVLARAVEYVDALHRHGPDHPDSHYARADLVAVVEQLRSVGLPDITANDLGNLSGEPTDTQVAAAKRVWPKRGSIRHQIVTALYFESGLMLGGLTDEELERRLKAKHTTVSAARNSLMHAGWVYDSGRRRQTSSNTPAIVWTLTPDGLNAIRDDALAVTA